jgi:hypothetical protein
MQPDLNATILALHESGHATRNIETLLGGQLDHTTIARRLQHLTPRKTTEIYKSLRADIFAEKQRKLLMRGNKISLKEERDLAVAMGVYYDKEQIERGRGVDTRPLVVIQINTPGAPAQAKVGGDRRQIVEVQS